MARCDVTETDGAAHAGAPKALHDHVSAPSLVSRAKAVVEETSRFRYGGCRRT
jgi:hypothetical protein